uniref:Uncharacterized protein n=1 Tax=Rhizophora mucronata TaxID=61149 RepID=A0A2P2JJD4_RHIMU
MVSFSCLVCSFNQIVFTFFL